MTSPEPGGDPGDEGWSVPVVDRAQDAWPGRAGAERGRPDQASTGDFGGDLWSAPETVVPVDDGLDGLLGGFSSEKAATATRPVDAGDCNRPSPARSAPEPKSGSPRTQERGARRSGALALAVAVVILITLGLAAQWLAPSSAPDGGPDREREPMTRSSVPPASLQPSSPDPERSRPPEVVTGGPPGCPMRLRQDRQARAAAPAGQPPCFFIE